MARISEAVRIRFVGLNSISRFLIETKDSSTSSHVLSGGANIHTGRRNHFPGDQVPLVESFKENVGDMNSSELSNSIAENGVKLILFFRVKRRC